MSEIKIAEKKINLILLVIILFGAMIRIYFLNLVKNQAHWWDSLAYGSLAKNMIFHKWDEVPFLIHEAIIRPPLLPLIWSWLIRVGSSDYTIIFITGIIPSIISIYLIYLIGKEMYGRNVGLMAAVFASVSWIYLFYSVRILTDIPSMCLALASIYFFIKCHNNISIKPWTISVFLLSLAVLFRYSHAVIALVYIVFLISVHKISLFKIKNFWIGGLIGSIPLILFIIINLTSYGSILPASAEYASSASEKTEFAWYTIWFINHILRTPLIFLFYAGLVLITIRTIMSYGFISKFKESKMNLFNLILLIFILSFFIFFIKASEDRYLLSLSSALFILPAVSLSYFFKITSRHGRNISIILCLILIIWSGYSQISFANGLILDKKDSFKQMKEAFEWINYNTLQDAVVIGDWAEPYTIYYSERDIQVWPDDLNFSNFTLEADYVTLTAVHQPNEKVVNYVNQLAQEGKLAPVKAFFFDSEEKQPAVIIYKRL